MAPSAPAPHWSRSIGTAGRDPSEWVVAIVGMRRQVLPTKRIELAATSVVASLRGQRSGASLPPLDEKRTDGIQRLR
jgi:hypothetical protein